MTDDKGYYLHHWLLVVWIFAIVTGCGSTRSFEEIPVSTISQQQLNSEFTRRASVKRIQYIVENRNISPRKKIAALARSCSIYDFPMLSKYLNSVGVPLKNNVLTLHTVREMFAAKMGEDNFASFECVEAAMLAAMILREKKIQPYILLVHGFNFQPGHAVCVFRTTQGWATVGVNPTDLIKPIASLNDFKAKLNFRIHHYVMKRKTTNSNIRLFSICTPENLHPSFVEGEYRGILWSNISHFFGSSWFK